MMKIVQNILKRTSRWKGFRKIKPGFIALVLILGSQLLTAQIPPDYLTEAAENNPELKAYFNEYLSALEVIPRIGSLPDPELTFGYFIRPMEYAMGNQRAELSLMQMFPWFGTLGLRRDEASFMARAKYEAFRDKKNQLYLRVKTSWYELYELESEISIMESNLGLLKNLEQLALTRFQGASTASPGTSPPGNIRGNITPGGQTSPMAGMGNIQSQTGQTQTMQSMPQGNMQGAGMTGMTDVLRIKMEINELENKLAMLINNRIPIAARFNQLLNRPPDREIIVADTVEAISLLIDKTAILDSISEKNPMIRMLDEEEEVYAYRQKMAKLEGRPMFGAGLNYMIFSPVRTGEGEMGGSNMLMPMIRLSLPIFRGKYRAMEREAVLRQESIGFKRENIINELSVETDIVLKDLSDSKRAIRLYKDQSVLADQALNILITAYSTGSTGFEEVIRMQKQLLDYKLALLKSIIAHNINVARLEMLTATEPEL